MCTSLSPIFFHCPQFSYPVHVIVYFILFPPLSLPFFLRLCLLSPCPLPSSPALPPSSLPQVLAQGIYDEFQSMVEMYGPESIGNLMPLVVNVLENLDSALADNQVIMQESIVCCMSI